jgi:hypothetical protein
MFDCQVAMLSGTFHSATNYILVLPGVQKKGSRIVKALKMVLDPKCTNSMLYEQRHLVKYKSAVIDCAINLLCFSNWLVAISPETLSSIQQHPVNPSFSMHIKLTGME